VDSAEDVALESETLQHIKEQCMILPGAVAGLKEPDRALIQALFFDGISTRTYARQIGVS